MLFQLSYGPSRPRSLADGPLCRRFRSARGPAGDTIWRTRMAAAALDADTCSLCRRHFLQGEAIRVYRESGARGLARVCPLCTAVAERRGWELCEATRDVP